MDSSLVAAPLGSPPGARSRRPRRPSRPRLVAARLALGLGLLAGAGGLAAAPARAQQESEAEARHHFRLGQAHYESGHFRDAAREFEDSYRLSGRPALLHNIYVAYRDAGMAAPAADALRRYLEQTPDVDNRQLLERRLANLERVAASQSDGDASDGADAAEATETDEVDEPDPAGAPPPQAVATSPDADADAAPASSGGGLSPIGFIVGGAGAALLVGAAITGPLALSMESDLADRCPNDVCPDDVDFEGDADTGRALAITTDVLLGVGAATLATGVVLLFVLQQGGDDPSVSAMCGPDGCMAAARATF